MDLLLERLPMKYDEREFLKAIEKLTRRQTSYDTTATVKRVEGNTAWVHIEGGYDETPTKMTVSAKQGDKVRVRIANGRAWTYGNESDPGIGAGSFIGESDSGKPITVSDMFNALKANGITVESDLHSSVVANAQFASEISQKADLINMRVFGFDGSESNTLQTVEGVAFVTVNEDGSSTTWIKGGSIDTKTITADTGFFKYLDTNYLTADFANLNSAEINIAKIKDLFVQVGLIRDATISEGHITGYLDAVQVNANNITAGTLVADRILLKSQSNKTDRLTVTKKLNEEIAFISDGITTSFTLQVSPDEIKDVKINGESVDTYRVGEVDGKIRYIEPYEIETHQEGADIVSTEVPVSKDKVITIVYDVTPFIFTLDSVPTVSLKYPIKVTKGSYNYLHLSGGVLEYKQQVSDEFWTPVPTEDIVPVNKVTVLNDDAGNLTNQIALDILLTPGDVYSVLYHATGLYESMNGEEFNTEELDNYWHYGFHSKDEYETALRSKIHGDHIIAKSLTATSVYVDDIAAFEANLGGFILNDEKDLYKPSPHMDGIYNLDGFEGIRSAGATNNSGVGFYSGSVWKLDDQGHVMHETIGDEQVPIKEYGFRIGDNTQYVQYVDGKISIKADTLEVKAGDTDDPNSNASEINLYKGLIGAPTIKFKTLEGYWSDQLTDIDPESELTTPGSPIIRITGENKSVLAEFKKHKSDTNEYVTTVTINGSAGSINTSGPVTSEDLITASTGFTTTGYVTADGKITGGSLSTAGASINAAGAVSCSSVTSSGAMTADTYNGVKLAVRNGTPGYILDGSFRRFRFPSGNATSAVVRKGYTFANSTSDSVAGGMDNFINQVISYTGYTSQPLNPGYYQGCSINFGSVVSSSSTLNERNVPEMGEQFPNCYGLIHAGEVVVIWGAVAVSGSNDRIGVEVGDNAADRSSIITHFSNDGKIQRTVVRSSADNYYLHITPSGSREFYIEAFTLI
jgi:hypothetical protein